jgi:bifunctional DNA-binding transcriptional regulator/antitoxin component of YhaV-PrlF toxin-antitoxin module
MARRKPPKGLAEEGAAYRPDPSPMALPDGTVRHVLRLGPKGRVLLPVGVRAAMGLQEGDTILGWLRDGKITLESQRMALKKIQERNRKLARGRSVVDELIAERRAAAARGE